LRGGGVLLLWMMEKLASALFMGGFLFWISSINGAKITNNAPKSLRYDHKAERGPHHRLWRIPQVITNAFTPGIITNRSYVWVQAGLNYWSGSNWVQSEELIEIRGNQAVNLHRLFPGAIVVVDLPGDTGKSSLFSEFSHLTKRRNTPAKQVFTGFLFSGKLRGASVFFSRTVIKHKRF